MKLRCLLMLIVCVLSLPMIGCGGGGGSSSSSPEGETDIVDVTVVNTLEDIENPEAGVVSLRYALAQASSGQRITFHESLNGGTIELSIVGNEHSVLVGEYMEMEIQPDTGTPISVLKGYFERDYGKSALYARKNVVIDASALSKGITISCAPSLEARVLAVYGDLYMDNVSITGGRVVAEVMDGDNPTTQTATLARGGGVAVWGLARLKNCQLFGNICDKYADVASERDQGAFGGGLYADVVELSDCVISGNSCVGSGVAGGGVFAVGGAKRLINVSTLDRCVVTGNKLTAGTAYGAGVYSDGGGIGKANILRLTNCTVAWNLVDGTYSPYGYWRGGGIYMSNGYMELQSCTIVDNHVRGYWREDLLGKSSLAGGVAATIGLAHAVESMTIGHCIIAGNTVTDLSDGGSTYSQDIFTGSLLYFKSRGYNRIGVIDFSQILVPVGEPDWWSLSRKHYPKTGDLGGVAMAEVLDIPNGMTFSASIASTGLYAEDAVVLHYAPKASALDQIPTASYRISETLAEYDPANAMDDNFLEIFLGRVEKDLPGVGDGFAADFIADFNSYLLNLGGFYEDPDGNPIETVEDVAFFGPAESWVKETANYPLILFWHEFDKALRAEVPTLGDELIGDAQWELLFNDGLLSENLEIDFSIRAVASSYYTLLALDQLGNSRPENALGDIGAIELVSD